MLSRSKVRLIALASWVAFGAVAWGVLFSDGAVAARSAPSPHPASGVRTAVDGRYRYLALPMLIPATVVFGYANWFGLKLFVHN